MRELRYLRQHLMDNSRGLNQRVSIRILHRLEQGWRDRIVEWMNGGFERKSRGGGKKWGERGLRRQPFRGTEAARDGEATDSIVFRPTSRRREINRAVCIHRRIFQRLSLRRRWRRLWLQLHDRYHRFERAHPSGRRRALRGFVSHSLNCHGYCIVSTYPSIVFRNCGHAAVSIVARIRILTNHLSETIPASLLYWETSTRFINKWFIRSC